MSETAEETADALLVVASAILLVTAIRLARMAPIATLVIPDIKMMSMEAATFVSFVTNVAVCSGNQKFLLWLLFNDYHYIGYNHFAKDCQANGVKCYNCGKFGHIVSKAIEVDTRVLA